MIQILLNVQINCVTIQNSIYEVCSLIVFLFFKKCFQCFYHIVHGLYDIKSNPVQEAE